MYLISHDSADPYFNLAVDEFLLRNSQDEYLILSVNSASVVTGKHQVAHMESDTRFMYVNGIPLIRRISGGGTVFHDPGNLNFSFISNSVPGKQIDFRKYTSPVIAFLSSLGVDARFEGKNDIRTDGLKISGNAEHVFRNRVLHHGTLLFDADLTRMKMALRKDQSAYNTRAVRSSPSAVVNLREVMAGKSGSPGDISQFRELMTDWFINNIKGTRQSFISSDDRMEIEMLALSKYRRWDWNYAYGPAYELEKTIILEGGILGVKLSVNEGIITACQVEGPVRLLNEKLCEKVKGCRHMPEDLIEVLGKEDIFKDGLDVFEFF